MRFTISLEDVRAPNLGKFKTPDELKFSHKPVQPFPERKEYLENCKGI